MKHTDHMFRQRLKKLLVWFDRHIPPGLRTIAGLILIIGGVFGFLPVLGFWMIPLGVAVVALDLKWLRGMFAKNGQ